jgi:3-phosphoshikimate 1-carboxyvinyltransferase
MTTSRTTITRTINGFPSGIITVPPSKSVMHRALICSALAGEQIKKRNDFSDDIEATRKGISTLITGGWLIDCGESGSTLRFLLPLAAAFGCKITFTGKGKLMSRPMLPYFEALESSGIEIITESNKITISGKLKHGIYKLPGKISSQYISGFLLTLPLLNGDSEIILDSSPSSSPYIDITLKVMEHYGVTAVRTSETSFAVKGGQTYKKASFHEEGDYSQAAFFLAAGALGCNVTVAGLPTETKQGDSKILEILKLCGVKLSESENGIKASADKINPITISMDDVPDLVPPCAALLCYANGTSRLLNLERLRFKESDRIESVTDGLSSLGADIKCEGNDIIINGKESLIGGLVNSHSDHRIAMMAAVAAIRSVGSVTVTDPMCVRKSFPDFWEKFCGQ